MSLKPNCGSMVNIEPYFLLATGHNRAEKWTVIGQYSLDNTILTCHSQYTSSTNSQCHMNF